MSYLFIYSHVNSLATEIMLHIYYSTGISQILILQFYMYV